MKISVVMPVYNGARFLAATLDSVLSQTLSTWELIVVDDGSTDHSIAMASSYAARDERIRVVCQCNGGVAEARNRGYGEISSGSAGVVFLDHDDVWHPEALSILSAELSAHPQAVAAHAMARKVSADGQSLGSGESSIQNYTRRKWINGQAQACSRDEPTTTALIVFDNWICTPGLVLIRRAALQALMAEKGFLFDPEAVPLDDWDFWLRLSLGGDLAFVDEVILDWRRHEAAGSQNVSAMEQAEWRLREKMARMPELSGEQRVIAENCLKRLCATRQRRDARRLWAQARASLSRGLIGAALRQSRQALAQYAGYVCGRRRRQSFP